jgi:CDP-glucose 4,6-dehydratase
LGVWKSSVEVMVIDQAFWRDRRVLLTGHTGFKGVWMSLLLSRLGAKVAGIALDPDPGSLFERADVSADIVDCRVDICDRSALKQAIAKIEPEIVFHLAAQSLVRHSYRFPVETFSTNVMGTVNLLDALRSTPGLKSVVIVTSDKVYRNHEWVWPYRESDHLGGHDPYSGSKAAAEIATASMTSSFYAGGAAITTARAGNVIGGGDFAVDRLVPDLAKALGDGTPIVLRNPLAVRPWQHVIDPLLGYIFLAQAAVVQPLNGQAFNFGPTAEGNLTVESVVRRFIAAYGRSVDVEIDAGPQPHEAQLLQLDATKARTLLGWNPLLNTTDAIVAAAKWYRAVADGEDPAKLTRANMEEFLDRIRG